MLDLSMNHVCGLEKSARGDEKYCGDGLAALAGTLRRHPKLRSVCLYLNAIGKKGVPILDQILRESAPSFRVANWGFCGFEKVNLY